MGATVDRAAEFDNLVAVVARRCGRPLDPGEMATADLADRPGVAIFVVAGPLSRSVRSRLGQFVKRLSEAGLRAAPNPLVVTDKGCAFLAFARPHGGKAADREVARAVAAEVGFVTHRAERLGTPRRRRHARG